MEAKRILLGHGSGGILMHDLIQKTISSLLGLDNHGFDDSAIISSPGKRLAFTTDSYVVDPLFFPGGNIGDLAINGTVNDLAVMGAEPLFISLSFILEEGLDMEKFKAILSAIRQASAFAGIKIVTGDTKVVNKTKADGMFINTSGVGYIAEGVDISGSNARAGDKIIISGPIGNHGISVIAERSGLKLIPPILSDSAALNNLTKDMLKASKNIHAMRDPTRGGLATTLKEIASASNICIQIHEESIPIENGVRAACNLLGYDPLYVANEGVLVAFVSGQDSDMLLRIMKDNPLGRHSAIIGEAKESPPKKVLLKTPIGGTRMIEMLTGEQLPRIC